MSLLLALFTDPVAPPVAVETYSGGWASGQWSWPRKKKRKEPDEAAEEVVQEVHAVAKPRRIINVQAILDRAADQRSRLIMEAAIERAKAAKRRQTEEDEFMVLYG